MLCHLPYRLNEYLSIRPEGEKADNFHLILLFNCVAALPRFFPLGTVMVNGIGFTTGQIGKGVEMNSTQFFTGGVMATLTTILFTTTAQAGSMGSPSYTPDLLPPNPQPGVCYARVKIPAQYTSQSHSVVVEDGYTRTEVSQPRLQSRQESVMVKEASVEYRVRQPRYQTVSEKVMVSPEYDKLSVSSPQFRTVTENIQVSGPRLVWKKGNPAKLRSQGYIIHSTADAGRSGQGYRSTTQYGNTQIGCGTVCEIWCLVEEPGQSVSYNRKVMTSPGEVRRHRVPARYETITKRVVADPGGVEQVQVPAEYRNITVQDVVDPGGAHQVNVPAKYGNVTSKVAVSDERYEWRQVVCRPGSGSATHSSGYSSGSTSYHSGSGTSSHYSGSTGTYGHSTGGTNSQSCGGSTSCQTYSGLTGGQVSYGHQGYHSSAKREKHRYRR